MAGSIHVRPIDLATEGHWSFRSTGPQLHTEVHGHSGEFDPFPAYPHDADLVQRCAEAVTLCCQPLWDVDLYIANREEIGRSNGYSRAQKQNVWVDGECRDGPHRGLIVLSGKRVPPHPAVTRYLVAHEYGHHIEWMLNIARGARHVHDETDMMAEYNLIRSGGRLSTHHGSGGTWHNSLHEVFACDFRILLCDTEPDYWPHPGVERPDDNKALHRWWADAYKLLADARRAADTDGGASDAAGGTR